MKTNLLPESVKKTYRGVESLPAVCSPEYHDELRSTRPWRLFVTEIGVQSFPPDPPLVLGNCPCCKTTLAKNPSPPSRDE